jgi:type IV secretory pathway component VirB8
MNLTLGPLRTAAVCLMLGACGGGGGGGSDTGPDPDPYVPAELAFVTTTDFATGSYSTVDPVTATAAVNLPSTTGIAEADNAAAYFDGRIYVLNRFGFDNVSVIDAADPTRALAQFSLGNGANPQDMAFVGRTTAYVSLYGRNELAVVRNPLAPQIETIDLVGYLDPDDADGLVEAGAMARVGTLVFVALQRLSNFVPAAAGVLAVIDTRRNAPVDVDPATPGVQGVVLAGRNPVAVEYVPELGRLLVAASGEFGQDDGGVELVDPFMLRSEGFLVSEAALGGDVGPLASVRGRRVYVVVGGFDENRIVRVNVSLDPATGRYSAGAPRDLGLALPFVPSLATDGADRLMVPDRSLTAPGLRIVDTFGETVGPPIDVGLPPNGVVVLPPTPASAFVTTTDFASGSYSTVNLADRTAVADLPATPGIAEADNTAVYFNDRLYVLNRFGFDSVSVLEARDPSRAVRQFSTGNGSNPQDMAFVSDSKAYVSLYGRNELLIVDPTAPTGREITGRVDLAGFLDPADADGLVEAGAMAMVGPTLFVALQRLSDFVTAADGLLAVIDTRRDTPADADPARPGVQGITLAGRNPVALEYVPDLGRLLVATAGEFGVDDGGIEVVDPFSFTAGGFLLTEAELGGDVGPLAVVRGDKGYAVVGGFAENRVVEFEFRLDPATGRYGASAPRDLGLVLPFVPSLAVDEGGRLLVPDRSLTAPGLRIVDPETGLVGPPIDVGLPPNTVVVTYR